MIDPLFALSGIGMMLVGLVPVLWWRYRTLVPWRDFWYGAGIWAVAISAKLVLDLSITPVLVSWLSGIYTGMGIAILMGAYVGLRTGFLESGLAYLVAIKKKLMKYDFQQAVAFGLGFGGSEAFLLGLLSFINIAVLLAFPPIIDLLPPADRAALLSQLTRPSLLVLAPIIERAFTILIHVFCAVLVILAVKTRRFGYFIASLAFKTLADGMLPLLTMTFDSRTVAGAYSIEAFVVALGAVGAAGLLLLRGRFGERRKRRTGKAASALMVVIVTLAIISFSAISAQRNVASPIVRRTINFDDFEGRYKFILNGSMIGHSEFEYMGKSIHAGIDTYMISEDVNLSSPDYDMSVSGVLHVTLDARPVLFNMTIRKNGDLKNVLCEFGDGMVTERITENNETRAVRSGVHPDSFLVANNMISHWALMFRAAKLEPQNTYIARIYSPNMGGELVRSLEISDVRLVSINGHEYEAYVFEEETGNLNYVTPEGVLLKIENHILDIVLSNGQPRSGTGLFR
ncbi:MAG: YhfC family intramembrane metalloprotease [Candidatus Aenigmarchaeota archaeon]|nr:YhfC family intramembrane metalloprotease [Candidatus Aenigmarchaeota archaeon]